jgi:valyl-tRNA synthetase
MQTKGLIEKIDENYQNRVGLCYKCKNILEPLPLEQWFVRVDDLKKKAIDVVRNGEIKITPKSFENIYFQWMENLRDWNISRQIVWGIRIPAWKNKKTGEWVVTEGETPKGKDWEQDKDTFDTWFSSGQWPFVTLKTSQQGDFEKFYPTAVLETAADILKAWVSRMIMLGIYMTGEVPFKDVLLHGMVTDPYGKKMSKSKGNVINPLELIDQYGADAVRFALIYGNATGNDQALSYPKLEAARKFMNKLWNMARFIEMSKDSVGGIKAEGERHESDKQWEKKVSDLVKEVTKNIEVYQFNFAAEKLYEFIWHEFADKYIEDVKTRLTGDSFKVLNELFKIQLKLLHPFMPFITEEIYHKLWGGEEDLIVSQWPQ